MEFDRTLLTDNCLIKAVQCIEEHGYKLDDFEFSTQRTHGYKDGIFDPKAVVYVYRLSSGIEMNYLLGEEANFSESFCSDLRKKVFSAV